MLPPGGEGEEGERLLARAAASAPRRPMSPRPSPPSPSSPSSAASSAASSGSSSSRSLREAPQPRRPLFGGCTRRSVRRTVAFAVILSSIGLQQRQATTLSRNLTQALSEARAADPPPALHQNVSPNSTLPSLLGCSEDDPQHGGATATNNVSAVPRRRNCPGSLPPDIEASGVAPEAATPPAASNTSTSSISSLADHAVVQLPALLARRGGSHNVSSLLLLQRQVQQFHKVPVVVWPLCETGIGNAVSMHLQTNGIQESPWLELSKDLHNFHPNVVWVGDAGSGASYHNWCARFYDRVRNATTRRRQLGLSPGWPIFIIDYTDHSSRQRCRNVEKLVGPEFVSYSKRGVVRGRRWREQGSSHNQSSSSSSSSSWVELGRVANLRDGTVTYRHTPFMVRTDTVDRLQATLTELGLALRDPIERIYRPVDVTHLWPRSGGGGGANDGAPDTVNVGEVESRLRTLVSDEIWRFANGDPKLRNWTVRVGLAGSPTRVGRQSVSSAYLNAMLSTKIMVVTQRDRWEDHYRLFEALVSGAMVMTDTMLSLPAGLKNGTSLVEFGSLHELVDLLDYYLTHQKERLRIAAEGRRVAMLRHRSWHRIEEVIFGRPLTLCDEQKDRKINRTEDCPYVVHANEAFQR